MAENANGAKLKAGPNPNKTIKCRFCSWQIARRYRSSKGSRRLSDGYDDLRAHVQNFHPAEFEEFTRQLAEESEPENDC